MCIRDSRKTDWPTRPAPRTRAGILLRLRPTLWVMERRTATTFSVLYSLQPLRQIPERVAAVRDPQFLFVGHVRERTPVRGVVKDRVVTEPVRAVRRW